MKAFLAPIAAGMGDLMVSLPAIYGLIESGVDTYLVTRSPMQFQFGARIEGLQGEIREVDLDESHLSGDNRFYNLREHPLQTEILWGSDEFTRRYPNYKIQDIVRTIMKDFSIPYPRINRPFNHREKPGLKDIILCAPFSAGRCKQWSWSSWKIVFDEIRRRKLRPAIIGRKSDLSTDSLLPPDVLILEDRDRGDLIDIVSSTKGMLSVDTGLMHLAIQQGIPTVGIFRNGPFFLRSDTHTHALIAPPCDPQCSKMEFEANQRTRTRYAEWSESSVRQAWEWDCVMSETTRCLSQITPSQVIDSLEKLLEARELFPHAKG